MATVTLSNSLTLNANGRSTICQILSGTTLTTSGVTPDILGIDYFSLATLQLNVLTVSGTTPTLDVYVQKKLADGTTYHDIAHFAQMSGTGQRVMSMVNGGNKEEAQESGSLAAGTVLSVHFGSIWAFKFVIGGTTPSFGFNLSLDMGN